MDYPTLNSGYSPEILAQADRLAAAFATKPRTPYVAPKPVAAPNGVMTEIGHGLAQGAMINLPTLVGQALKAPGQPGDFLHDTGQGLVDRAKAREDDPLYKTDSWLGEGAGGVAPALAAMAAAPLLAAGGVPAAVGVGASALAAAGLFGGASFQDTYEKAKAAGASEEDAHAAALKVGAIQGVGQGAASAVGGRVLSGVAGSVIKSEGAQGVMNSFVAPRLLRQIGVGAAENVAVQVPTQAGAMAAQSAVERDVGIDAPSSWEAAKASVLPTLAMTTLLTPFSAAGTLLHNRRKQQIAKAVVDAPPADATEQQKEQIVGTRLRAAGAMAREMRRVDPETANQWEQEAIVAINRHEPVALDVKFTAEDVGKAAAAGETPPAAPEQPFQLEPAPQGDPVRPLEFPDQTQFVDRSQQLELPLGEPALSGKADAIPFEHVPIEAPLDQRGQGALDFENPVTRKSPTSAGSTAVEDATARLQAAREDGAPGQGTSLALGLGTPSAIVRTTENGSAYSVNKQERVKWLRAGLGTAPSELVGKLASLEPHALADALQTAWHQRRGDEGIGPKYNVKIEELYKQLTGKDIRQVEATPEGSRRHFTLDAPNAEELAQQQRDAVPRGTSGVELTAADKGQITKRQGGLFEAPKPLTKAQQKAQQDAATLLTKEIDRETANEEANRTKSEATDGKGATTIGTGAEVRQGQGDANAGRGTGQNEKSQNDIGEMFNALASDSLEANPIVGAVSRFGGREFDGPIHAVAINKAIAAGALVRGPDGKYVTDRTAGDSINDLHRRADGSVISKDEAAKLGSARNSEDLPHGRAYKAANPVPAKRTEASVKAERAIASATAAAEQRVTQIGATLAKHDARTQEMQARLREVSAIAQPTREQFALKQRLESEIGGRSAERVRIEQLHGDAMADAIDARDGRARPENTAGYWQFADNKWDHQQGIAGQNLINMHSYLEAKAVTGVASKEERALLGATGMTPRTKTAAREAQLALDALPKAERAAYDERIQHYTRALKLATEMGKTARELETAAARSATAETVQMAGMKEELHKTEVALQKGLITPEAATERYTQLMENALKLQNDMDSLGRGLSGLKDQALGAHMNASEDSHATTAMAFVAKHHRDPTMRAVAKMLYESNLRTLVKTETGDTFDGARYVPRTDTIEVGRGGMNAVTMVHETVHAAVHHALGHALMDQHANPEGLNHKRRVGLETLQTISEVMNKFREMADLNDPAHRLALSSHQEFIAEALANPSIQQLLGGRAGLMTRVYNAIAKVLGLSPRQVPDFQRLMDAAPTLFGDPRRDSMEVFQRAINNLDAKGKLDPENNPRDAITMTEKAHNALSSVGAKIVQAVGKDPGHEIPAEGMKWLTLNHNHEVLKHLIGHAKRAFPEASASHKILDRLDGAITSWKAAVDARQAENQHLKNESQAMQRRVLKAQSEDRPAFDRWAQMGRDGKKTGVYPGAKTLAEAQKFNPKVMPEMYNHAVAKAGRDEYARLEKSHPELVKLYNDVLQKHRLDHARQYAQKVALVLKEYGMQGHPKIASKYADLDWINHRDVDSRIQEDRLKGAITHAQGQVDQVHKDLNLVEKNVPEGKKSEALKDATQVKETLDGLISEYDKQRTTPYLHQGRAGDYHVMFEVTNLPGAWDRVGKIVNGSRTAGGLERDWNTEPIGKGDKSRRVYMRFDNEQAHNDAVAKLQALRKEGVFDTTATDSQPAESTWTNGRVDEKHQKIDGATPQFIRTLHRKVMDSDRSQAEKTDFMREITDTWLQQLPETSPLKAAMFADNVSGASKDFVNTFADRMTMSNSALVTSRSAPRVADALRSLSDAMREVNGDSVLDPYKVRLARHAEEMKGRAADLQQPVNSPRIDQMRAITAFWRLGISPAYTLMTMYQPWQVTLPLVGAKHGMVSSARTMAKNFAVSVAILQNVMKEGWGQEKGNAFFNKLSNMSDLTIRFSELKNADGTPLLSKPQLDLLDHLQWSGLLNFGQTQQIARMDAADLGVTKKISNIASVMPHYTEVSNRITGALTAYEMHLKANPNDAEGAKKYALEVVRSADGDHSQANVARRLGRRGVFGAATPLAVGFQQYNIQMTELLARTAVKAWGNGFKSKEAWQAQKALMGIFTTTGMMAGALGLPFASLAVGVANAVSSILGDANDEPADAAHSFRGFADSMFGEKGGEILSRGLPRALDFDMSSRSGYQEVLPFSKFMTDRRKWDDRLKDGALDFLGPAVGAMAGVVTGAEAAYNGDYVKAINDGLPTVLRNPAKAYRLSQYGYETQGGNNSVPLPVNSWNVFAQSLGFTSGGKADQSERSFEFNTNQQLLLRRQQVLRNAAYRAIEQGDYSNLGRILQQNIDFAVQHPGFHANIAEGLKDRARQRFIGEFSGTGVLATPSQYPRLQQYFPQGQ